MLEKAHIELHAHPVFKKKGYALGEVVNAMDMNNLDIVALSYLDQPILKELQILSTGLKRSDYKVESDSVAFQITRGNKEFYILKGVELNTSDNFHILAIGYDTPPEKPIHIDKTIDLCLENNAFVIFDHPFVNVNKMYLPVKKKKHEKIRKICRDYSENLALEWNSYCKALYWGLLRWNNVNKKVIKLSQELKAEGYNIPVIADTDLHAKTIGSLDALGTSRIKAEVNLSSGQNILNSLKQNVFSGNYENVFREIPSIHLLANFALPYIGYKLFKKGEKQQIYHIPSKE